MKLIACCVPIIIFAAGAAFSMLRPGETLQSLTAPPAIDASGVPVEPAGLGPIPPPVSVKSAAERAADALLAQDLELTPAGFVSAASRGAISQAGMYLETGFHANERDPSGRTPLIAAAQGGHAPLVKSLLAAGAEVGASANDGVTALMAAARAGSVTTVEALLNSGAALDPVDALGRTALLHAVSSPSASAAAALTLVSRQADVTPRDSTGRDSFDYVMDANGDTALARALLTAGPRRPAWTAPTREALFHAVRIRDAAGVRLLLDKHAAPPTLGDGRQTLLAYTIAWNDLDQLRLLLSCGADPNVTLSTPVEKDFIQCFSGKMLPHYLTEERGMTPLMLAAGLGRSEFVQALVDKGARTGAVTAKHKIAPLSFAAWAKDVPSQLVLLGKTPRPEEQPLRVRISLGDQRAYVYKGGEIALTTQVSTGRAGFRTPTGEYVVTDKHLSRFSSLYKVPMPYFMRLSCSEFGMHAGVVPGYPASHGCIRMPRAKVQELFRQVSVGTPVSVTN